MNARKILLVVGATISMQAGAAFADGGWTFEDPFWKRPIDITATGSQVEEPRQPYDFLTRFSAL